MAEALKRHTAYKVWINALHSGEKTDATGIFAIQYQSLQLVRVNIIGNVTDVFASQGYGSLLLDDGSGSIRVKVWGDDMAVLDSVKVGDVALVIGRTSEFQGERYVRPEIVRIVTLDWALFRRLELVKLYGAPNREEKVAVPIEDTPSPIVEPSLAAREAILSLIEKYETVDEATLLKECSLPKQKVLDALQDLLKEGEIFSPKKGFFQLV